MLLLMMLTVRFAGNLTYKLRGMPALDCFAAQHYLGAPFAEPSMSREWKHGHRSGAVMCQIINIKNRYVRYAGTFIIMPKEDRS